VKNIFSIVGLQNAILDSMSSKSAPTPEKFFPQSQVARSRESDVTDPFPPALRMGTALLASDAVRCQDRRIVVSSGWFL
jgi:hypothetical protein